jgi:hypothetical protein
MPWKAVKKNRAKPTTKVDMKVCCQARGFGLFDAEVPHGEGRRGLDAHQGEHVGQAHDRGPAVLALGGADPPVDDPGHFQQKRLSSASHGPKTRFQPPMASGGDDVVAQQDDAADQQDELEHADPGAGLQPPVQT